MSRCCPNCFRSKIAKKFIRKNGDVGVCDYCKSKRIKVMRANELRPLFEGVVSLYQPLEHGQNFRHDAPNNVWPGESLWRLINDDWGVFNDDLGLDWHVWDGLMDDIWVGGLHPRDQMSAYLPSDEWVKNDRNFWTNTPEQDWSWFACELKRGKLDAAILEHDFSLPEDWLEGVIRRRKAIRMIGPSVSLFRGRKGFEVASSPKGSKKVPYSKGQMGPPPAENATAGRANREGCPVFYAAFDQKTAVIEAGRFPGATVSVREAKSRRKLRIVDLTAMHGIVDPLGIDDLYEVDRHIRFINQLNIELSKPVHPDDSALEYLPTQYLARLIQDLGFDGIAYRSALNSEGENLVLFDTEIAKFTKSAFLINIERVQHTLSDPQRSLSTSDL